MKSNMKPVPAPKYFATLEDRIRHILGDNVQVNIQTAAGSAKQLRVERVTSILFQVTLEFKQYSYCCGMFEIGNISWQDNAAELNDNVKARLISKFIVQAVTAWTGEVQAGKKYGFSCTLPVSGSANDSFNKFYTLFGEGLERAGFTLFGTFVNKNSSNTLNHYILL